MRSRQSKFSEEVHALQQTTKKAAPSRGHEILAMWQRILFGASDQPGKWIIARFVLYSGSMLTLFGVWFSGTSAFTSYIEWNASASSTLLNLLGQETGSQGSLLYSSGGMIQVMRGCDGLQPTILLVAAILSFPSTLGSRCLGITLGAAVIALANLVRISSLFALRVYLPNAFQTAHETLWPTALVLFVLLLWLIWIRKSQV